jgi:DNA-binding MarR family transcriptional regulator
MAASRKPHDTLAPDLPRGAEKHADETFVAHLPEIDYGVLDKLVGYAIRRAQIKIYEDFIAALAEWNITPPRFSALTIVARNPDLKLTELAQILGIARSGAVLLVDALQEMRLVERHPSPTDRRAYSLVLTAQGKRTLAAVSRAVVEHDARVSQALSSAEKTTLLRLLGKLAGDPS